MELEASPSDATRPEERALDPAVRRVWLMNAGIGALVMAGMAVAAELLLVPRLGIKIPRGVVGGAWFALTALPSLLMVNAQYRNWRFNVNRDEVTVRYGVLWRTVRTIPRQRIQHVDVHSGPVDRAFGLSQVSIFTAGSIAAVISIPGLSAYDAERLRTDLMAAIKQT